MAFVLIQHLEPKHESALTTLLSKATGMPVTEVTDGLEVQPNHVYVIPPNRNMTIGKGSAAAGAEGAGFRTRNGRLTIFVLRWPRNRATEPSAWFSRAPVQTELPA